MAPPDARNVQVRDVNLACWTITAVPRWAWSLKETSRPTMIQYIDKIVGVPGRVKQQVATALVRGTADARDPDVQKKTLAGNGIVMARAGSTARVVVRAGSTAREHAA